MRAGLVLIHLRKAPKSGGCGLIVIADVARKSTPWIPLPNTPWCAVARPRMNAWIASRFEPTSVG